MKKSLIALCFSMIALGASAAQAGGLDDRLGAGEVIVNSTQAEGQDVPKVKVMGVINAPMDKVWALVSHCDDYEKTMLNIKLAEEKSRKGNTVVCRTILGLPWPMGDLEAVTEAVHVEEPGKLYSRTWKLVSGNFDFNNGSWTLKPFKGDPNRTLAVYQIHVKPRVSIPDAVRDMAQESTLPDLYKHLRSQLEKK